MPYSGFRDGYKAYGAKDAVGETEWKSGSVNAALPRDMQRKVILTRYDKPVKVLSDVQVARMIAKQLRDGGIDSIPYNVITPGVRKQLEKQGFNVSEMDHVEWGRARKAAGFDHIVGGTDLREKIYPQEAGEAYNEYSGSRKISDLKEFFRGKLLPLFDREDGTRGARVSLGTSADGKVEVLLYRGRRNKQDYLDHVIVGSYPLGNNKQRGFRVAVLSNLESIVRGAYYTDVTGNDDRVRKKNASDFHSLFFAIKVPANEKYKINNDGVYIGRLVATESPIQEEGKPLKLELYDIDLEHKYKSPKENLSPVNSAGIPETGGRGNKKEPLFQRHSLDDGISLQEILKGVKVRKKNILKEYLDEYTIDGKKIDASPQDGFDQIIGEQGMSNSDKIDGKTLRQDSLALAKQMLQEGKSAEDIWAVTNCFQGKDGRWRYEIPDGHINPTPVIRKNEHGYLYTTLGDILSHEDFFKAYPEVKGVDTKNLEVLFTDEVASGAFGRESPFTGNPFFVFRQENFLSPNPNGDTWSLRNIKELERIFAHEKQHFVQFIEGFSGGSNPKKHENSLSYRDSQLMYRFSAGENEAESVKKRLKLSEEERKKRIPYKDEPYDRDYQIADDTDYDAFYAARQKWFDEQEAKRKEIEQSSPNGWGFLQIIGSTGDEQDKKLLELHRTGGYRTVLNSKEYQESINPDINSFVNGFIPTTCVEGPQSEYSVLKEIYPGTK